jgi:import receptor subunit TOM70
MPPGNPTAIPVDPSSGVWDRITNWVSENKAVVYTIAGVSVVVTGAGIVYYLSDVCLVNPASTLLLLLLPPTSWCG